MSNRWERLHDYSIKVASNKLSTPFILFMTFLNSSIFPVPQDVFIVPALLARPHIAFRLAFLCTVFSTLGGIVGYGIGIFLYDTLGQYILDYYGYEEAITQFQDYFMQYGPMIIVFAAITPFPYKVVTILSGFIEYNFLLFVIFSSFGRGCRFFLYGVLFYFFGERMQSVMSRWFHWMVFSMLAIVIIIIFFLVKPLFV